MAWHSGRAVGSGGCTTQRMAVRGPCALMYGAVPTWVPCTDTKIARPVVMSTLSLCSYCSVHCNNAVGAAINGVKRGRDAEGWRQCHRRGPPKPS